MRTLIRMKADGRLTIPAEIRRELGIEGQAEFEIELNPDQLVLRLVQLPREDAWAYTPEHRELLRRAHADSHEGRVRVLDETELERLGE